VIKAHKANLAVRVLKDRKAYRVQTAPPELMAHKVNPDQKDHKAHKGQQAMTE
jgi:hypothetical protein